VARSGAVSLQLRLSAVPAQFCLQPCHFGLKRFGVSCEVLCEAVTAEGLFGTTPRPPGAAVSTVRRSEASSR
jgi:hypothetical protein